MDTSPITARSMNVPLTHSAAASLTHAEIAGFIQDGFVVLPQAFDRDVARQIVPLVWDAAGLDPVDRSNWKQPRSVVPRNLTGPLFSALYSPRLRVALDQLLGPGRSHTPNSSGYLLLNLPGFDTPPWQMMGGHIDGSHFHHHIDSREQGLVLLFIFTDVQPQGGGTAVCPGSHARFARALAAAAPTGMTSAETCHHGKLVSADIAPIELTAHAGDVVFLHPMLFHGSSSNLSPHARLASNMCVGLHAPMDLRRGNPDDYSPVERAIVQALALPPAVPFLPRPSR